MMSDGAVAFAIIQFSLGESRRAVSACMQRNTDTGCVLPRNKCDVAEPGRGILEVKVLGVLPYRGTSPRRKRPHPWTPL